MADSLSTLSEAVQKGDTKLVVQAVDEALDGGILPTDILHKGLMVGIQSLSQLFREGQAYLPEILVSTMAMKSGVDKLVPRFQGNDISRKGTVVLGTVYGDMHDIGKNLVKLMLECSGYEVHDLGKNVPIDAFIEATRDVKPDIVGLSALLTTTMTHIPQVMKALEQAGLRSAVRIVIGGAPITRQFADEIGVEGYADDCASAVDEVDRLMK